MIVSFDNCHIGRAGLGKRAVDIIQCHPRRGPNFGRLMIAKEMVAEITRRRERLAPPAVANPAD